MSSVNQNNSQLKEWVDFLQPLSSEKSSRFRENGNGENGEAIDDNGGKRTVQRNDIHDLEHIYNSHDSSIEEDVISAVRTLGALRDCFVSATGSLDSCNFTGKQLAKLLEDDKNIVELMQDEKERNNLIMTLSDLKQSLVHFHEEEVCSWKTLYLLFFQSRTNIRKQLKQQSKAETDDSNTSKSFHRLFDDREAQYDTILDGLPTVNFDSCTVAKDRNSKNESEIHLNNGESSPLYPVMKQDHDAFLKFKKSIRHQVQKAQRAAVMSFAEVSGIVHLAKGKLSVKGSAEVYGQIDEELNKFYDNMRNKVETYSHFQKKESQEQDLKIQTLEQEAISLSELLEKASLTLENNKSTITLLQSQLEEQNKSLEKKEPISPVSITDRKTRNLIQQLQVQVHDQRKELFEQQEQFQQWQEQQQSAQQAAQDTMKVMQRKNKMLRIENVIAVSYLRQNNVKGVQFQEDVTKRLNEQIQMILAAESENSTDTEIIGSYQNTHNSNYLYDNSAICHSNNGYLYLDENEFLEDDKMDNCRVLGDHPNFEIVKGLLSKGNILRNRSYTYEKCNGREHLPSFMRISSSSSPTSSKYLYADKIEVVDEILRKILYVFSKANIRLTLKRVGLNRYSINGRVFHLKVS